MLVLSQRMNDSTTLTLEDGRTITATIVGFDSARGQVKVSWDAPKTINILRNNAVVRVQKEQA